MESHRRSGENSPCEEQACLADGKGTIKKSLVECDMVSTREGAPERSPLVELRSDTQSVWMPGQGQLKWPNLQAVARVSRR